MSNEVNPFASPAEVPDGGGADRKRMPAVAIPYASAAGRATAVVAILCCIIVLNVVSAGSMWMQVSLLERIGTGDFEESEAEANDQRQLGISLVEIVLSISSAVAFLMWFHRSHRNLPSLGNANLEFTPGWAVGWWFIPFFNLVRPYQVTREIWRGSDPEGVRPGGAAYERSLGLVVLWWLLFLAMNFADRIAMRISRGEQIAELILASHTHPTLK